MTSILSQSRHWHWTFSASNSTWNGMPLHKQLQPTTQCFKVHLAKFCSVPLCLLLDHGSWDPDVLQVTKGEPSPNFTIQFVIAACVWTASLWQRLILLKCLLDFSSSFQNAANLGFYNAEILSQITLTTARLRLWYCQFSSQEATCFFFSTPWLSLLCMNSMCNAIWCLQLCYCKSLHVLHACWVHVLRRVSYCKCPHFKGQNIPLGCRIVSAIPNSQVPIFSRFQMYANVCKCITFSWDCRQPSAFLRCLHLSSGHKDRFHYIMYQHCSENCN